MDLVVEGWEARGLEMAMVDWGLEVEEIASLADLGLVGLSCWVCIYKIQNQGTSRMKVLQGHTLYIAAWSS